MARITTEILDQWHQGNDEGEGYALGLEHETPQEAVEHEGWDILARGMEGMVLARRPDGQTVLVCNANGPWCVDVVEE